MVTVSNLQMVYLYGMKELPVAYLYDLKNADKMTGLNPFMLTASENINSSFGPDLSTVFTLVKTGPELVKFHHRVHRQWMMYMMMLMCQRQEIPKENWIVITITIPLKEDVDVNQQLTGLFLRKLSQEQVKF